MNLSELGSLNEYEAWWDGEAKPLYEAWLDLPFFRDLQNGKLTQERLKVWLENWYYHVQECDIHRPVLWSRHHYIVGRYPQLEEIVTERAGKPLNYPYPGGQVGGLRRLVAVMGMSHEALRGARLRSQTAHLTTFVKSLYLEGTLAEFASQLIGEEYFLRFCNIFQAGLCKQPFNFKGNALDYFKYWKGCLLMKYGSAGKFLLNSLFEKGIVEERPNFGIKHVAKRYPEYLIRFYEGL